MGMLEASCFVALYATVLVNLAVLVYLFRRVESFRRGTLSAMTPYVEFSNRDTHKDSQQPHARPHTKLRPKFVSEERAANIADRLMTDAERRDPIRR